MLSQALLLCLAQDPAAVLAEARAAIDSLLDGIEADEVPHLSEQLECIARKSTKGED